MAVKITPWDYISGNCGPWWYPWWGGIPEYIKDEGGIVKGLRWWWTECVTSIWGMRRMEEACEKRGHNWVTDLCGLPHHQVCATCPAQRRLQKGQ